MKSLCGEQQKNKPGQRALLAGLIYVFGRKRNFWKFRCVFDKRITVQIETILTFC